MVCTKPVRVRLIDAQQKVDRPGNSSRVRNCADHAAGFGSRGGGSDWPWVAGFATGNVEAGLRTSRIRFLRRINAILRNIVFPYLSFMSAISALASATAELFGYVWISA